MRVYLVDTGGIVRAELHEPSRAVDGLIAVAADVYEEAVVGQPLPWPRATRNRLLLETDFVELPGYVSRLTDEQRAAWQTYRDALRDMTTRFSSPIDVQWPQRPDQQPTVETVSLAPPLSDQERTAMEAEARAALIAEQDMWSKTRPPPPEMPDGTPAFVPASTDPGPDMAGYQARLDELRRAAEQHAARMREQEQSAGPPPGPSPGFVH